MNLLVRLSLACCALACLAHCQPACSVEPAPAAALANAAPSSAGLKERMRFVVGALASDPFAGRRVGTPGNELARALLEYEMRRIGLTPLPGQSGYALPFQVTRGIRAKGELSLGFTFVNSASASYNLLPGQDFSLTPFSGSGNSSAAELIFAGYGISAPDLGYDDYAGQETAGRAVLILRGEPQQSRGDSPFAGAQPSIYSDLRRKASGARDLGVSVLLVAPDVLTGVDGGLPADQPTYSASNFDIPVVYLTRAAAERLMQEAFQTSLTAAAEAIEADGRPHSLTAAEGKSATAAFRLETERDLVPAANIAGMLEGSDPALKEQYIVLGAHYDHLGIGGPESLAPERFGEFHHGADDNASGCAAILAIAQSIMDSGQRPARSLIFVGWDAEEIGTVGSAEFVKAPPVPLESIYCNLNFDMIGRMDEGRLIVDGLGTAEQFEALLRPALDGSGLTIQAGASGFGASDHMNFVAKGIPVLFFFTGTHEDYHRPSDTADKINYDGMLSLVELTAGITGALARNPDALTFVRIDAPETGKPRASLNVTLGTVPSYVESDVPGMAVGDVRPGGPAQLAGIAGGDVIVRIDGKKVANIQDFIFALQTKNPGDVVEVVVLRDGAELSFMVALAARNVQQ